MTLWLNIKTSLVFDTHSEFLLRLAVKGCTCWYWKEPKTGIKLMKAVPSGACTKRVRFAFPPRFCERTWWLMSYIRILYRCETYFTGKNIWYKFHAFLIHSPKSCYSSALTWPTVDIGRNQEKCIWSRLLCGSSTLVRGGSPYSRNSI